MWISFSETLTFSRLLLVLLPFLYTHTFTTLLHQQKSCEATETENILSLQVASLLSRIEEFGAAKELLREERHNFRHKISPRKERGFGARSIVTFCEKNGAFYAFKTEGRSFILKIIFR